MRRSAARGSAIPGDTSPTGPLYPHVIGLQQPWELPKIEDVFESGEDAALSEDDLRENARIIEETLQAFGVEGKVIEVNRGPAITQFGVEPGFVQRGGKVTKVKVSKITALADDLALALAAKTIRIEAPVPGRNIVGIEVPNAEIATVALRDVIESESFQKVKHKGALPIALGQDVSGQAVASDLSTMPHLLIAGTTGSGKSVCVNAIISCLMAHFTPDELRMLMVDPKRVELTTYNGVPHLLAPVVVDLEKVTGVLNWVTREMDERYRRFAKSGSRNIDDYNTKIQENNLKEGAGSSDARTHFAVHRGHHRRVGRPDDAGARRNGKDDLPSGADGARHRHSPDHRHAAPQRRRGHGLDQSQLPGAHRLLGGVVGGLARDPRHDGGGKITRAGRHAVCRAGGRIAAALAGLLCERS